MTRRAQEAAAAFEMGIAPSVFRSWSDEDQAEVIAWQITKADMATWEAIKDEALPPWVRLDEIAS